MTPSDPRHGTRRGYKTGAELTATPLFDEPGGALSWGHMFDHAELTGGAS